MAVQVPAEDRIGRCPEMVEAIHKSPPICKRTIGIGNRALVSMLGLCHVRQGNMAEGALLSGSEGLGPCI